MWTGHCGTLSPDAGARGLKIEPLLWHGLPTVLPTGRETTEGLTVFPYCTAAQPRWGPT